MALKHQRLGENEEAKGKKGSKTFSLVRTLFSPESRSSQSYSTKPETEPDTEHGLEMAAGAEKTHRISHEEWPDQPFRQKLSELFHSHRFHLTVIGLVIMDCLIVVAELIIDLEILSDDSAKSNHGAHTAVNVLHTLSVIILCVFMLEIVLKVFTFRVDYFKNKMELFDGIVVTVSLVFDLAFFNHADVANVVGLVVVLRLWRVTRVLHGIVVSVKAPIEHRLEKERKLKEKLELDLKDSSQYISSLEEEITILRAIIEKNNILEVPNTCVKMNGTAKDDQTSNTVVVSVEINAPTH